MRIAFIVSKFPTVTETFILNQITGLIDRGHEVDIYAETLGDTYKIHSEVRSYHLIDRTCFQPWMPRNQILRLLKGLGLLFANFHKGPMVLMRSLNVFKYGKQAISLRLLYAVIPLLFKRSYDIIHCHFGPNGLKGVFLRDIGILQGKVITAFHGNDMTAYIQKHGVHVYDPLLEGGDLFLPINERWKYRLIELGCDEKEIKVHRMGIDCSKFRFSPRRLHADGSIWLVTIARLAEKKGLEYGIRAIVKLAKVNQKIEYNIIGGGPLKEDLQRLIQYLNASDIVKLLGWKQQQEIIEILNNAHIMVAPSVTSKDGDQEGIPIAMMEAMAMGLPIISTQHSGIPELIQDGISGFLVPERDVDALAEKINFLIKHPEVWSKMGRAGRSYVEKHYDINKLNNRLVEIFRNLLKNGKQNE